MTVTAGVLRQLHRIHLQLSDLKDRQERGPKQIQARSVNLQNLKTHLAQLREEAKVAQVAAHSKELTLKTNENKIRDLNVKLNMCSTPKEYKALQDQIAADEMACSVLADEILEAFEKVDQIKSSIPAAELDISKAEVDLEALIKTVTDQAERIKADIERLEKELKICEAAVPAEFRDAYDRVIKSLGEDALAPVEGQTCTGCNYIFTANMLNALNLSQIVFCKQCGRLLYLPEDRSPTNIKP